VLDRAGVHSLPGTWISTRSLRLALLPMFDAPSTRNRSLA